MLAIQVSGRINEKGQLEIELPEGLPAGEVQVEITFNDPQSAPWTSEELREMLRIEPLTGKEIVEAGLTGGWEHKDITDSSEWVQEQRYQRRQKRGIEW